jgi:hypothetical protein
MVAKNPFLGSVRPPSMYNTCIVEVYAILLSAPTFLTSIAKPTERPNGDSHFQTGTTEEKNG